MKPAVTLETHISERLVCPSCHAHLLTSKEDFNCNDCQFTFTKNENGIYDFRLPRNKRGHLSYEIPSKRTVPVQIFRRLEFHETKNRLVDDIGTTPYHFSDELLSHFPVANSAKAVVLDLGCGAGIHRKVCEAAGFQYVGLDYESNQADLLGDGQALPFRDNSFDFVLSMAVLEHVQFPSVFASEIHRILKPGGILIGTVAFLEPFHGDSHYHHTHLGTYNTLNQAGLAVEFVAPNPKWPALHAIGTMSLFPRLPFWLVKAIMFPVLALHRVWWMTGRILGYTRNQTVHLFQSTGSLQFKAHKPKRTTNNPV